jgi:transketolase
MSSSESDLSGEAKAVGSGTEKILGASVKEKPSMIEKAGPHRSLEAVAKTLRRHVIRMLQESGSGHPGGSLSATEIITALYFHHMKHNPADPCWPERDRFILSKGHAAPLLYAAMAECGYFPVEELKTLRKLETRLQGHPDRTCTPGIEGSTGSLGQGLSFGVGTALSARLNSEDHRVYVLLGDGECDEGQVWEAAMAASHFKLDKLVAIVDHNKQQIDGWNKDIMNLEPLDEKWHSFGWHVMEVDGHDLAQVVSALEQATHKRGCPTVIIAHTIKGKGVSFMERNLEFHGKAPSAEEAAAALKELE